MALETATYVADLVETNPPGTDPKKQGDDHLRLIKLALHNSFAGLNGQIIVAGTEAQGATVNDFVLTVTADTAPTALHNGMIAIVKASHTNIAGACTLGINAITAVPLLGMGGKALSAGDLANGYVFVAVYDSGSTSFYVISPNDRLSRAGDTIASLIVSGALTVSGLLTLASLAVTGQATGTTPSPGDNTTKFATTEFVVSAVLGASATIPGQTGKEGLSLVSRNGAANWGISDGEFLALRAAGYV